MCSSETKTPQHDRGARRDHHREVDPVFGGGRFDGGGVSRVDHLGEDAKVLVIGLKFLKLTQIRPERLVAEFSEGDNFAGLDKNWYQGIVRTEIAPLLKEYWFDNQIKAEEAERRLLA